MSLPHYSRLPLQGIPLLLSCINAPFRLLYLSSPGLSLQSLSRLGKKPLTLTFYFQLVDQYQPIALSRIHWWQSIKRSKGDQTNTPGSVIYLFVGWTAPGFISSWVYRATVVNFVSLRGLTNHGVNFISLRGLTNHGIDATDRLRTIYVRAYHALMASSLQSVNLLTERNQLQLSRFNYW